VHVRVWIEGLWRGRGAVETVVCGGTRWVRRDSRRSTREGPSPVPRAIERHPPARPRWCRRPRALAAPRLSRRVGGAHSSPGFRGFVTTTDLFATSNVEMTLLSASRWSGQRPTSGSRSSICVAEDEPPHVAGAPFVGSVNSSSPLPAACVSVSSLLDSACEPPRLTSVPASYEEEAEGSHLLSSARLRSLAGVSMSCTSIGRKGVCSSSGLPLVPAQLAS
jgi:hypothetical protein